MDYLRGPRCRGRIEAKNCQRMTRGLVCLRGPRCRGRIEADLDMVYEYHPESLRGPRCRGRIEAWNVVGRLQTVSSLSAARGAAAELKRARSGGAPQRPG